jgi:hypothetical protein
MAKTEEELLVLPIQSGNHEGSGIRQEDTKFAEILQLRHVFILS